jgi:hypothetical protein
LLQDAIEELRDLQETVAALDEPLLVLEAGLAKLAD